MNAPLESIIPAYISRSVKLLENPSLVQTSFAMFGAKKVFSNCWGTAIFVLGLEHLFLNYFAHDTREDAFNIGGNDAYNRCVFPHDLSRPGYVSSFHMGWFLSTYCLPQKELERDFFVCTYQRTCTADELLHTAICIGERKGKTLVFEQLGYGEVVRVSSYDEVVQRKQVTKKAFYEMNVLPQAS